jgi:hypothetical protein
MPIDLVGPDLVLSLGLDPYAPRAARYHVAQVDRPSPDLRDAVVLLTSELITRAVQQCQADADQADALGAEIHLAETHEADADEVVELRVWMPADVVRVELHAARDLLVSAPEDEGPHYDMLLLDQVADRWSIDASEQLACIWFEIDRHRTEAEPEPDSAQRPRSTCKPTVDGRRQGGTAAPPPADRRRGAPGRPPLPQPQSVTMYGDSRRA